MYIVRFVTKDGYFGPFETQSDGEQYISDCNSDGTVVSLVKPYALGKIEADKLSASVSLASEHGGE